MDYCLLGALEVRDSGRAIALGRGKQRALLAMLLVHEGETVSTDRLIEALWGGQPPPSAANSVHVYVSQLRKALGDGRLVTRPGGYAVELHDGELDSRHFERLVTAGRAQLAEGNADAAATTLAEALALWRGPPLAEFAYAPFAQAEIARLEEERISALEERIDARLALGEAAALVPELESLVREHPLRERLRGQLMLALYRSERQADALAAYREGRSLLVGELGLEPGPALQELQRAMLRQDASLSLDAPQEQQPRSRMRRSGLVLAAASALLLAAALGATGVELTRGDAGLVAVSSNSLAAIDPGTNRIVGEVPVGARPGPVAFGAGSLWVANRDDETVSRVTPSSLAVVRTLPVGAEPTGLAAAGHAVWVVGADPSAPRISVRRIDTRFDAVRFVGNLSNVVAGGPGAVTAGRAAVWVAPSSGLLTRLDPGTGRVGARVDPNTTTTGIASGLGALWLLNRNADTITRIDPTGLRSTIPVGRGPSAIAVGAGGVWVTDALDNTLVHIDPSTRSVVGTTRVGRLPYGVAVGFGSVWVANAGDGTVSRVNASTNAVATIHVGGSPQSIAAATGRVWVTVAAALPGGPPDGGVVRIERDDDLQTMDPALVYDPHAAPLISATCAGLLGYPDRAGPAGSQLEPEVAQAMPDVSADGRTYTFRIRDGFRFSSGERVTANTFAYTIERSLSRRMNGPGRAFLGDVVGARMFMAGKAAHIAGVRARGPTLTIRLVAPAPDLPTRLAQLFFCAVPLGTPLDPRGVRTLPAAGPYHVVDYTPGQGVVLERNPYYRGSRPHSLRRIVLSVGVSAQHQMDDVASGKADIVSDVPPEDYRSPAMRRRLFVNVFPQLDFLVLNTHRPLFADSALRRAASYAVDRTALARLGDPFSPIPGRPTDQYLPPGLPGFRDVEVYPFHPDVAKARRIAAGRTGTAVLYTCDQSPCDRMAQIIKTDLAAIGIRVEVKAFTLFALFTRIARKNEPFDIAWVGWVADYPDPQDFLGLLLESGSVFPAFDDPAWKLRLARAAALSGPRRFLTYGRLDVELARDAAPWIAYSNRPSVAYLSPRLGCRVYHPVYGLDLAALCVSRRTS